MGLFALNWGLAASVREGKRQKCGGMALPAAEDGEHEACLYDAYLQKQQRSFCGLHHYQQQLQLSPPPQQQQQQHQHQQQQLLSNLQALQEKSRQEMFLSRMNFGGGEQHVSNWNHHQSDKLNALKSAPQTYQDSRSPAAAAAHEHLFYKVVTPSDVGKLNRLVIPKQHAERWFPLDPCLRKKGRLLSFQDVVSRELWWFRYSYWSSSQSYVLTKGWIRFVKDKDLQAGDIISFERGARHELYINCRKRPTSGRAFIPLPGDETFDHHQHEQQLHQQFSHFPVPPATPAPTTAVIPSNRSNEMLNLSSQHSSSEDDDEEAEEAAVSGGTRLFGVDLRANPVHKLAL